MVSANSSAGSSARASLLVSRGLRPWGQRACEGLRFASGPRRLRPAPALQETASQRLLCSRVATCSVREGFLSSLSRACQDPVRLRRRKLSVFWHEIFLSFHFVVLPFAVCLFHCSIKSGVCQSWGREVLPLICLQSVQRVKWYP